MGLRRLRILAGIETSPNNRIWQPEFLRDLRRISSPRRTLGSMWISMAARIVGDGGSSEGVRAVS